MDNNVNNISTEESLKNVYELYVHCQKGDIDFLCAEIDKGNGIELLEDCFKEAMRGSEDRNKKLFCQGRLTWLIQYLFKNHHLVFVDWLSWVIDNYTSRKGVDSINSLENLLIFFLKLEFLTIHELENLIDKRIREDFVYGERGSTKTLKYLVEKLEDKMKDNDSEVKEWYSDVFANKKAFALFERFMEEADSRAMLRECSFIYREMCEKEDPALIHQYIKPGMFRKWFNDEYKKHKYLSEIKTHSDSCSISREKKYKLLRKQVY